MKKKALEDPARFLRSLSGGNASDAAFRIPHRQQIIKMPPLNLARIKNVVFAKPHMIQDKAVHMLFSYMESMEEHAMRSIFGATKATVGADGKGNAAFLQSLPASMAFAVNPSLAPLSAAPNARAHNLRSSSSTSLPVTSPPFSAVSLGSATGSIDSPASALGPVPPIAKVSLKKARKLPGYRLLHNSRSDFDFAKAWRDDDVPLLGVPPAKRTVDAASHEKILRMEGTAHVGFRCDLCHIEPIVGARWECKNCPAEASVDLCNECIGIKFEKDHHKPWHSFVRYV